MQLRSVKFLEEKKPPNTTLSPGLRVIQSVEMSDIKCLEHHTLKVPYEVLNKRFRATQKVFDRKASHVQQTAADLEKVCRWLLP